MSPVILKEVKNEEISNIIDQNVLNIPVTEQSKRFYLIEKFPDLVATGKSEL